jgi:hypothetical protein
MEESRSQTLNYEPSPRGKPVFISYFPFNLYFVHRAYLNFKFNFTIALISKQDVEKQFWRFFGDTTEPRGMVVPPLDKIFVHDIYRRRHECLEKI